MGKNRTPLGKAELPRSLAQFLEAEPSQLSISLLLRYIDELEALYDNVSKENAFYAGLIAATIDSYGKRLDAIETALKRAQGKRILGPILTEDVIQRKLDRQREQDSKPWKNSRHRNKAKGTRRIP